MYKRRFLIFRGNYIELSISASSPSAALKIQKFGKSIELGLQISQQNTEALSQKLLAHDKAFDLIDQPLNLS
jgi:hypothetical protein